MDISFGRLLKISVEGASHSRKINFSLFGLDDNFQVDKKELQAFVDRRTPGKDEYSTARKESDKLTFIFEHNGYVANEDTRPGDYADNRTVPRPGHADFPQWVANGRIPTGGGTNSGRLTVALCAAGGICKQYLKKRGIEVKAEVTSIGGVKGMALSEIENARKDLDSVGGEITCSITGFPAGRGGALADGIESELSAAIFAIPGVKGISFGMGESCAGMRGSQYNDAFVVGPERTIETRTNRQGGILGGRTTGMPIVFNVAMRPTPTIGQEQDSVNLETFKPEKIAMKGRHDPCIVRRAVPVVEAMAAFAMTDVIIKDEFRHPRICLTLTGRTLDEDYEQFVSQRYFVDMVEVRADLLKPAELEKLSEFPKRFPKYIRKILTIRRKQDGGEYEGSEKSREQIFEAAFASYDYVDFEDDFHRPKLERKVNDSGVTIVRSLHSFDGPVENISERANQLVGFRGEIAKIAFTAESIKDCQELLSKFQLCAVPHIFCAMGNAGVASRVLAVSTRSKWTYVSVGGLKKLGHLTPQEIVRDYRIRELDGMLTHLYGVTGWPLEHTLSPAINNAAWYNQNSDKLMVPMPAKTAEEALAFMKAMRMHGMAVTIPHKQAIMPLLDKVDELARKVGAVNTVALVHGKYIGHNTDVGGFECALNKFLQRAKVSPKSVNAAVLGDGGVAQAVKLVLKKKKITFSVFHRETPPAGKYNLFINATPVDPIEDYEFTGSELVFDLRYVENNTLLDRAAAAGCQVENGLTMLEEQAALQREIWGE